MFGRAKNRITDEGVQKSKSVDRRTKIANKFERILNSHGCSYTLACDNGECIYKAVMKEQDDCRLAIRLSTDGYASIYYLLAPFVPESQIATSNWVANSQNRISDKTIYFDRESRAIVARKTLDYESIDYPEEYLEWILMDMTDYRLMHGYGMDYGGNIYMMQQEARKISSTDPARALNILCEADRILEEESISDPLVSILLPSKSEILSD